MLTCKTNLNKTKNGPLSELQPEKITFPPKPDVQIDIRTDGHKYLQSSFANKKAVMAYSEE